MASPAWIVGQKYRVTYRLHGQRMNREGVVTFLGKESGNPARLQFDARPAGGTQTLPKADIQAHWPVPMREPHTFNERSDR